MGSIATAALHDPQTLYARLEHSQWNPFAIDLSRDAEQWATLADRALIEFVLGSLMVAEERITTKFSGLVGERRGYVKAGPFVPEVIPTRPTRRRNCTASSCVAARMSWWP